MEIIGYSERGVINSLFYEVKFSQNNLQHLSDFLSKISFPYREVEFKLRDAMVMIELSFSDFGDALFVALVPDCTSNLESFYKKDLIGLCPRGISGMEGSELGLSFLRKG